MTGFPLPRRLSPLCRLVASTLLLSLLVTATAHATVTPRFAAPNRVNQVGVSPTAVFVADQDGDGFLDIAVANKDDNSITFLRGRANGFFDAGVTISTNVSPQGVAMVDLSNDGLLDLVYSNSGSNTVRARIAVGAGAFGPPGATASTPGHPLGMAVGDFDQNGKLDIAVAIDNGSVLVLTNNGGGGFATAIYYLTAAGCSEVETARLNADVYPDIVSMNPAATNISVLLNTGTGSFPTHTDFPCLSTPTSMALGDANADTKVDVVVSDATGNVSRFAGDGLGGLGARLDALVVGPVGPTHIVMGDFDGDTKADLAIDASSTSLPVLVYGGPDNPYSHSLCTADPNFEPHALATADFNGDGRLDLVCLVYRDNHGMGPNSEGSATIFLANCDGTLGTNETSPTVPSPVAMAKGDFNGDGIPDIVTVDSNNSLLDVLLGDISDSLSVPATYATGLQPRCVAAGDLNGDGKLDLAVGNSYTPMSGSPVYSVSVLLGNGDGTFQAHVDYTAQSGFIAAIKIAELTGDTKADVVTAGSGLPYTLSVFPGVGAGVLGTRQDYPIGSPTTGMDVGDLNNDGIKDVVVATNSSFVVVFLNPGTGVFSTHTNYTGGGTPFALAVADLNGDGYGDVATANGNAGTASVMFSNNLGTLSAPVNYPVGTTPYAIVSSDLNSDGLADLAILSANSRKVSVLANLGAGAFAPHVDYGVGGSFSSTLVAADLDLDGYPELLVGNSGNLITILRNLTNQSAGSSLAIGCGHPMTVVCGNLYNRSYPLTNTDIVPLHYSYSLVDPLGWITSPVGPIGGMTPTIRPGATFNVDITFKPLGCPTGTNFTWRVGCGFRAYTDSCNTFVSCPGTCPTGVGTPGAYALSLRTPSPNPFRGSTRLDYEIPIKGAVRLEVFSADGRRMKLLVSAIREAGPGSVRMDGKDLGAGVYFARLTAGGETRETRLVLLH